MPNKKVKNPVNQEKNRNSDGTFIKGRSGNPNGRPPGKSLKEYDRERFSKMTDEEKEAFLKTISSEMRYRMAEGNPQNDVTTGGEKIPAIPIYSGKSKE